jgi:nucleotidyltransferase/DNA polymerase involved in DNA repair
MAFLHQQPCRKVGGVGKVTERVLREVLQVDTVAQLYERRVEVDTTVAMGLFSLLFTYSK